MAGHSKWSNIKDRKGKEDSKRAKEFTKLGRYITVAAKEGGADEEYNPALKAAVEKAKAGNMPNDNIDRAIKRGTGELGGAIYEEMSYEGYGPEGVAVYVSCLTDNKNRTASYVRHTFDKFGGNLGQTGCVSFMFDRKGLLAIEKEESIDEDELMLQSIDFGAEDFDSNEYGYEIITSPEDFDKVRDSLSELGYNFAIAEITFLAQNTVAISSEENIENMEKLIETLEDNDDVQDIYHSWDMEEE